MSRFRRVWNQSRQRIVTLMSWQWYGGDLLMVANSVDAARWLIFAANDQGQALTNFQVQKLLYYAHGESLSKYGTPLVAEGFQAWEHGPVCPPVYRAFNAFDANPIVNIKSDRERIASRLDSSALVVLEQVWSDYGDWSASELWDDTHRPESPWERVYEPGVTHTVISDEAIKQYFSDLQSPKLRRSMNRLRKRRDERGDVRGELIGDAGLVPEIDAWSDLRTAGTRGLLG